MNYEKKYKRLQAKVKELYLAAYWSCPKHKIPFLEQARLWDSVRKAAGIRPGTATKHEVGALIDPNLY